MAYYSAHYGNWNEPGGVVRVEFGKERGISNLYHTESWKEAQEKAQDAANNAGKVVTVMIETPTGSGMTSRFKKLYPIRGKIRFVRMYKMYRENWYEVIYRSGRIVTYTEPELPATVNAFVESSTIREQQHDKVFHRDEMLYY